MKFLIALPFFATVALAARLDNTYLPPQSSRTAGGSGSFLSTPVHSTFHSGSSFGGFSRASSFTPGTAPSSYAAGSTSGYGGASAYSGEASRYHSGQPQVKILRLDSQNEGDGRYNYQYETENKISVQEAGEVRNVGGSEPAVAVHGSYSYLAPDGQHITVNYVADENGFRPEGAHLPTPPPIPEEIRRSVQVSAASCAYGGCENEGGYSTSYSSGSAVYSSGSGAHSSGSGGYSSGTSSNYGAQSRQYLAPAAARSNQYLPPSQY